MNFLKFSLLLLSFSLAQFNPDDMSVSGSFGSVTIDNEVYNQIALRPEIPIGNLGIGLDLYFYINGEGKFYKENWDFSSAKAGYRTLMDKIYYFYLLSNHFLTIVLYRFVIFIISHFQQQLQCLHHFAGPAAVITRTDVDGGSYLG